MEAKRSLSGREKFAYGIGGTSSWQLPAPAPRPRSVASI